MVKQGENDIAKRREQSVKLLTMAMVSNHSCMARGGHGLPNVSLGPAMPYLSTPCGRATPETAVTNPPWIPHTVQLCQ
jgi:hypothetical protein